MGCWNKTCGLTGLPIFCGDKVYTFLLEQNGYRSRCYPSAFWKPLLLPFVCEYNDYGGGENSEEPIGIILEHLKKVVVDVPQGKSEYHDIAVKADLLNEDLLFNAVTEGRLFIRSPYPKSISPLGDVVWDPRKVPVDLTMIRKDVVDEILETWAQEEYVGKNNGTTGWNNSYKQYKFSDVESSIPELLELMKTARANFVCFPDNAYWRLIREESDSHQCSIVFPYYLAFDMVKAGDTETAASVLRGLLIGIFVNRFMNATRKVWMPGSHEGSQNGVNDAYLILSDLLRDATRDYVNQYGEEE